MKKRLIQEILILIFRLAISINVIYFIYPKDKLTAILLAIIFVSQPLITLLSLKEIYKINKEMNYIIFSIFYAKLGMILSILYIVLYIISWIYFKMNPLAVTISSLFLVYGYVCEQKSYVLYDLFYVLYYHKIIEISKIQSIQKKDKEIKLTFFNKTTKVLKLRNKNEVEIIERILRRK